MNAPERIFALRDFKNHDLVDDISKPGIRYEKRPAKTPDGATVPGLYNAWITLDNEAQYNSYTTDMVKGAILAFRAASNARDVNCVVFTGAGDKAFCTGGNTKEYAEYYAGHPQEYRQYMRLFNDMVSAILACDKPVICRVNGMRIGGGQEIGMACDFSVAQDLARFGQAGPKHGSAPIGGATDFLPVMVGAERAMAACVLCEPFSAHKAYQMGVISDLVPALRLANSSPTHWSKRSAWSTISAATCLVSPGWVLRPRRPRRCWPAAASTCRCSTPRSRSCARRSCSPSPTARPARWRNCASPSSRRGTATRKTRAPGWR